MSHLPEQAKLYLVESLNSKIFEETKKEKPTKSITGSGPGMGVGTPGPGAGPKGKKKEPNVLFGDTEDFNVAGVSLSPELVATGLYGAGKAADFAADWLDASGAQKLGGVAAQVMKASGVGKIPVLGDVVGAMGSGLVSAIPGAASTLLRQASDISGANWFDANIKKIGRSTQELAAQGAGSPWTALAIPGQAKSERKQYDPNKEQDDAIKQAKREDEMQRFSERDQDNAIRQARRQEEIKLLKSKGYKIP
jgi:hypothetical protein